MQEVYIVRNCLCDIAPMVWQSDWQMGGQVGVVRQIMRAVVLDCMQVVQLLRNSMPPLAGKAVQVQGASHGGTNSYFRAVLTGNQEQTLPSPRYFMPVCCDFPSTPVALIGGYGCQGPGNALDVKPKPASLRI